MPDQERRVIARALGLPDKAVTPQLAAQYELTKDGIILKEEKNGN